MFGVLEKGDTRLVLLHFSIHSHKEIQKMTGNSLKCRQSSQKEIIIIPVIRGILDHFVTRPMSIPEQLFFSLLPQERSWLFGQYIFNSNHRVYLQYLCVIKSL